MVQLLLLMMVMMMMMAVPSASPLEICCSTVSRFFDPFYVSAIMIIVQILKVGPAMQPVVSMTRALSEQHYFFCACRDHALRFMTKECIGQDCVFPVVVASGVVPLQGLLGVRALLWTNAAGSVVVMRCCVVLVGTRCDEDAHARGAASIRNASREK